MKYILWALAGCGASAGLFLEGGTVRAQDVSAAPTINTAFDRTRTTAVADRIVPGYEPRGVTLGGFLLLPELDAGASAVDNLYAASANTTGDVAAVLSPAFALTSQWSRNLVAVSGRATFTRFVSQSTEDSDLYRARVQTRYDIGSDLAVAAYGDYRRDIVPRSQPGNILGLKKPLFYNVVSGGGSATWTSNRLRLAVLGNYDATSYDNLVFSSGLVELPAGLNRHEGMITATAEYAITSDFALLVQARTDRTDYQVFTGVAAPDRSSIKHELLVGSSFEVTDFFRGELALGYIDQQFNSPTYRNYKGFGGRVKLQLFPSQLTTTEFDLSRTLNEADNPLDSNYVLTSATVKLDHELLRNLVLTPSATYSQNDFQQIGLRETQARFGFNAAWLLDHNWSLQGQYQHVFSRANLTRENFNFDINVFSITAAYRF